MARYLFVSWDGGGNQPPTFAVARRLRDRGHHVLVAGYPSQGDRVRDNGLDFRCLPSAARAAAIPDPMRARFAGIFANADHVEEISRESADFRSDVLVIDCMLFGALAGAEAAHLDAVTFVHSGPRSLGGAARPPMFMELLGDLRSAAGLSAVTSADDAWRRFPALATSIPELDGPAVPGYQYIGPVFDERGAAWTSPWAPEDKRPLVVVSLTTTRGFLTDQLSRYQAVMDGCADLPVRVLVTTGGGVEAAELQPAANAVVVDFAPHESALKGAAVCVTHAGHGTVCAALRAGAAIVCLPGPYADQPSLSSRIAELGAGLHLDRGSPASEIRDAVAEMLGHPGYREAAARLAAAIDASPGAAGAVDILEAIAPLATPV